MANGYILITADDGAALANELARDHDLADWTLPDDGAALIDRLRSPRQAADIAFAVGAVGIAEAAAERELAQAVRDADDWGPERAAARAAIGQGYATLALAQAASHERTRDAGTDALAAALIATLKQYRPQYRQVEGGLDKVETDAWDEPETLTVDDVDRALVNLAQTASGTTPSAMAHHRMRMMEARRA